MQKVLIVNPFGIGDVLFTTPMIVALGDAFPGISISYLASGRAAPLLKNNPCLKRIFLYDRDEFIALYKRSPWQFILKWKWFVDELRDGGFDTVFDFSFNSGIGLALWLAGIPRRIGYDYKGRGRFLTEKIPLKGFEARPVAEYYLDLLGKVRGVGRTEGADFRMALYSSKEDHKQVETILKERGLLDRDFVVIFPGGGASWGKGAGLKRWSVENYAKLADKIVENTNLVVILMGDKSEVDLCKDVAGRMRVAPFVLAGMTTIPQSAALLKRAQFVLANDGGPLHVAVASGARTISIFGPVDPAVYGPYPAQGHEVITKGLVCQPCYRHFHMSDCDHLSCLKTLTVEEVYRKVESFYERSIY